MTLHLIYLGLSDQKDIYPCITYILHCIVGIYGWHSRNKAFRCSHHLQFCVPVLWTIITSVPDSTPGRLNAASA
jgi:hypothetical protein